MNNQQAIFKLSSLARNLSTHLTCDEIEAITMGMEALEMRTPKEPPKETYLGNECPNCGGRISIHNDYCPHCGQAIDWDIATVYECPKCHSRREIQYNFCSDCGAKMEVIK